MTDFKIHLGKTVTMDGMKLVDGRALFVGTSGAGKSYLIRVLCEQVVGKIPTIILDRDGEFASLRENHDVVLIGEGGEADASLSTAAKLARSLVELGVSAVINLYDLSKADKRKFVRIFLDALMSLPRATWRPMFVVVDEAHEFCPESGREAESGQSVIRLMDSGRKQGKCGILCTQRFSKLSKDAAAEASNVCIGRITLDNDLRRASDTLGFTGKTEWQTLRGLADGEWFGFGPAFEHRGVERFQANRAKTTHPKAGERHKLKPPAPSKAILKVAPELAALKLKVAEEKNELDALRAEVKELRSKRVIAAPPRAAPPPAPAPKIDTAAYVLQGRDDVCRMMDKDLAIVAEKVAAAEQTIASVKKTLADAIHTVRATRPKAAQLAKANAAIAKQASAPKPNGRATTGLGGGWEAALRKQPADGRGRAAATGDAALGGGGKRRMMIALVQQGDAGATRSQLAILSGMSVTSGTFANYLSEFRRDGWIRDSGGRIYATDTGTSALGDYKPLPQGHDLVQYWLGRVGQGGERRVLEVLCDNPDGLSRLDLAAAAELSATSGTYANYLSKFRKLELIQGNAASLRPAETLLEALGT